MRYDDYFTSIYRGQGQSPDDFLCLVSRCMQLNIVFIARLRATFKHEEI
jgi:hypothetical protein